MYLYCPFCGRKPVFLVEPPEKYACFKCTRIFGIILPPDLVPDGQGGIVDVLDTPWLIRTADCPSDVLDIDAFEGGAS